MAYDAVEFLRNLTGNAGGAMTVTPPRPRPRVRAAAPIRRARKSGQRHRAIALRDAWAERVAVCIIMGGMNEAEAERIAADEVAPADGE